MGLLSQFIKGDVRDPKNYRPITIVSCLGKLFTAILNARLNDYTEEFMILKENQSGFRQSYSTLDSIFSIFTLFQILSQKRRNYIVHLLILKKPLTEYGEMVWSFSQIVT